MEKFKQSVAAAAAATPGGRFNRADMAGLFKIAMQNGVSVQQAREVLAPYQKAAKA